MSGERCKKHVHSTNMFHSRRCLLPAVKDGLCKVHQPEAIREREAKREQKFEAKSAAFRQPWDKLKEVTQDRNRLTRQLEKALGLVVDGFETDPGTSDLDDEQPIYVAITLGQYRKARARLRLLRRHGKLPEGR